MELGDAEDSGADAVDENALAYKLQCFYVALRTSNYNDVAWYATLIEDHIPSIELVETSELVAEIIQDCRSKCSQFFRSYYSEQIRILISTCRKKIIQKAAIDAQSSSQHHQRHLNVLRELFGTWSNIMSEMTYLGLSVPILQLVCLPIHVRIKEVSIEIFKQFKEDKSLDNLQSRIVTESHSFYGNGSSTNRGEPLQSSMAIPLSIGVIDSLICQIVCFRETIASYYSYLKSTLLNTATHQSINSNESLTVVLNEPTMDWRELDAYYISFEYAYISLALKAALQCNSLLETEDNVFVPQGVEDSFFLFNKIVERAMSTQSESLVFAIGNKLIELLDGQQESLLYEIVGTKKFYYNCVKRNHIILPSHLCNPIPSIQSSLSVGPQTPATFGKNSVLSSTKSSHSSRSPPNTTISGHSKAGLETPFSITNYSSSNGNMNGIGEPATTASPLDLGSWFVQALQIGLDEEEEQNTLSKINNSGNGKISGAYTTSLSQIFEDLAGSDVNRNETDIQLTLEDKCVFLSTVSTVLLGISSLRQLLIGVANHQQLLQFQSQSYPPSTLQLTPSKLKSSPLTVLKHELSRCLAGYTSLFNSELRDLSRELFSKLFEAKLNQYWLHRRLDVDGECMDRWVAEEELSTIFRRELLGSGKSGDVASYLQREVQVRLASHAYREMLYVFAEFAVESLKPRLMASTLSEWGALLIKHEISRIISAFQQAESSLASTTIESNTSTVVSPPSNMTALVGKPPTKSDDSSYLATYRWSGIIQVFGQLSWFGTLVTMDQPGYVRRYNVPSDIFDEATVRVIMARRVDFSLEAIEKVKINIV